MSTPSAEIFAARILIVDDQVANVQLLQQLLAEAGYTGVETTMDPQQVCPMHQSKPYDLILLDLQMPTMDGFKVLECLNQIEVGGYAPVMVMTAQPGHKLRALASGAKDFMSKPYELVEVTTRIRNMIEMRLLYKRLQKANAELASLALHDALTGLPNRRLLVDRLKRAMTTSARTSDYCALMFLDLDHFKLVNDNLGHDAGDVFLQQVAARLQSCVREGDSVARLGGDEFVVLLESLSSHTFEATTQAKIIANKILDAFVEPFLLDGEPCNSTPSIGIAVFKGDHENSDKLLKRADVAMYHAKVAGRNTARFYSAAMVA